MPMTGKSTNDIGKGIVEPGETNVILPVALECLGINRHPGTTHGDKPKPPMSSVSNKPFYFRESGSL